MVMGIVMALGVLHLELLACQVSMVSAANRPFATNGHMVQNPPYWRASSLLFPHWDIKTKASQA